MIQEEKYFIEVTQDALDLKKLVAFCLTEDTGAVDVFVGTVRDHFEGKAVTAIDYQGYPEMAEKVLQQIIEEVFEKWSVNRAAVQHRLGLLHLKDASVIIAVSTAHRKEAFEACRHIIEQIKKDLPVWKKEYFSGGETEWKNDVMT